MSCEHPTSERPEPPAPTNIEKDEISEACVLAFVLEQRPDQMTVPELSLAMNGQRDEEFLRHDAVERAIVQLTGAGLIRIAGGLIVPTRAALYFERLSNHL